MGTKLTVILQLLFAASMDPHEFDCVNGPLVLMLEIVNGELAVFASVRACVVFAP